MKKITKFLAIALLLIMSLAACQAQTVTTTSAKTEPTATTVAAATTPSTTAAAKTAETTVYPYEFKTADGGKVVLDKEPQRIISLSPTFTEVVYALGAGDRLVGRTDYCDYPLEAAKVTSVGSMTKPSVEKITELKPDVVLVSFMDKDMVDKIQLTGAKVIQLSSGESIEGSYQNMAEIAKVLNENENGAKLIDGIKTEIAAVNEKVKALDPIATYYVVGFGKNGDYTAGDKTFINDLITAAGGKNVATDAEGWSYTSEKLMEKDPKFIIMGAHAQMTDAFKTTEPYKNLTAVKEGRVLEIDENLMSREGPRMGQGVKTLAEILHPEAFK